MAKKKTVSKINKEELVEKMKATPMVPSEMFGESSIAEEQIMAKDEGEFAIKGSPATDIDPQTITTDSGTNDKPLSLKMEVEDDNLSEMLEKEEEVTLEGLAQEYKIMQEVNYQLIEKQYILEWQVFGEEYKGKYKFLQIDEGMYIFGTSKDDLEYLPAKSIKEAYEIFIDKES